jgi:predicted PurR-regulated permease PerM
MVEKNRQEDDSLTFQQKVWITCGTTALFVVLIWFFKVTFNVFLLILAGALIALFFHGFAELIQRKLRFPHRVCLLISVILTFVIISLSLWFMGARIQEQVTELARTLPATISNAKSKLATTPLGQKFLEKNSDEDIYNRVYSFGTKFFNSTFGVFTDIYIVLFLGLFFTAAPKTYINGFLNLVPEAGKKSARYTIERIGFTLTKWLKGQIIAMVIIAILKGIALSILNVPMAIALALIAGILNFIPNFGPLISMFPAILIALTQSVNKAIVVTIVYLVIQILEGNVITPAIQQRLINMPAALIIIAQLFMGLLAGVWGLILATPLVAILIVIVEETYVKRISGEVDLDSKI